MTQATSSGATSSSEGEAKSSAKLTPLQEVAMKALRLDEFKKTVLSQLIVGDFPKPETREEFEAQRSVVNACTTQWAGLKGWGAKWATEHTGEGVDVPLPTGDAPIRWGDLTDFHGATTDGLVHRAWRGVACNGSREHSRGDLRTGQVGSCDSRKRLALSAFVCDHLRCHAL